MNDVPVILIGGVGRTGTNALKYAFSKHPDVFALPFETRFTIDPDGILPTYSCLKYSWSPFVGERAILRMERLLDRVAQKGFLDNVAVLFEKFLKPLKMSGNIRKYKEWELNRVFPNFEEASKKLINDLVLLKYKGTWAGAEGSFTNKEILLPKNDVSLKLVEIFRTFFNSIYIECLDRNGKRFYVEDNTYNIFFFKEYLEILPNSFLVHMVRDPRDVVASYMKQRWCPASLKKAINYYKEKMLYWNEIKKTIPVNKFIEVKLEDLCINQERKLREICNKVGMSFHKDIMKFRLNESNTGRWEKELSNNDRLVLKESLKDSLKQCCY